MTGDIAVEGDDANTKVAFKNCFPFTRCVTHINDEHIDTAENLDIIMPMCSLIEYSDNYSDTSGSLWQFKRDEQNMNDARNPANVTTNDTTSFKCKSSSIGKSTAFGIYRVFRNVRIAVPLAYLTYFFKSIEIPSINCKILLELSWSMNCVMSDNDGETTFKKTNTKLHVPIVTLLTKDKANLTKKLNEGFKRPVYWNKHKTKIESKNLDNDNPTRFYLDASFQVVKRLFVLALTILMIVIKKLKETAIENTSFQG